MNPTDIQREARELALHGQIGFAIGVLEGVNLQHGEVTLPHQLEAVNEAITRLRKVLPELQRIQQEGAKDGERLDWLEANMGHICNEIKGCFAPSDRSPTIRAAIDAARTAHPDERKET